MFALGLLSLIFVSVTDAAENQVPGPPTSLRVHSTDTSIMISWTPPLDDRTRIRGYLLGWGIGLPDILQEKLSSSTRQHTIENLNPGREYVLSLRAFNKIGNGFPIYETVGTLDESDYTQGQLSVPIGLRATTVSDTSVRLSWTDTDSAADGRFYTLRASKYPGSATYANATETSHIFHDLEPNTDYEFTVRTVLGELSSPWSMSVSSITPTAPPSADITGEAAQYDTYAILFTGCVLFFGGLLV